MLTIPSADSDQYEALELVTTGGYDWACCALLRHKATGQMFFATDCGCSCNGWWDIEVDAEPVASWQEWAQKAREWDSGAPEVMEAMERLNQSRPKPVRQDI